MFDLETFQYTCMTVMFVSAFFTVFSRFYVSNRIRVYERSRWLMTAALLVFGIHYLMQYHFGWRAQGDDVDALFGLIFYAAGALLLSLSLLNVLVGKVKARRSMLVGVLCYAVIAVTAGLGVAVQGSVHIGDVFWLAVAAYLAMLCYYIRLLYKRVGQMKLRFEWELGYPFNVYLHMVYGGIFMLCAFAWLSPFFVLSAPLLYIFAPVTLLIVVLFVARFISLGFNLPESVLDITTASGGGNSSGTSFPMMTAGRIEMIERAVNKWQSEDGFRDSNLTLDAFTRRVEISRTDFISYLSHIHGVTFLTWLSGIRIREAKTLMAAHPEYNNRMVATECGFSSRVYFQRIFKETTGLTPSEWKQTGGGTTTVKSRRTYSKGKDS